MCVSGVDSLVATLSDVTLNACGAHEVYYTYDRVRCWAPCYCAASSSTFIGCQRHLMEDILCYLYKKKYMEFNKPADESVSFSI